MLSERGDITGIMAALSASLWQTWSCLVDGDPPAGTDRCTDRLSPLSPLLISEHIGEASSLSLLYAMIAGTSPVNSECSPCLWNPWSVLHVLVTCGGYREGSHRVSPRGTEWLCVLPRRPQWEHHPLCSSLLVAQDQGLSSKMCRNMKRITRWTGFLGRIMVKLIEAGD